LGRALSKKENLNFRSLLEKNNMNDDQMKIFGSCKGSVFLAFILLLYAGVSDSYAQQKDQSFTDITGKISVSEIKQVDLITAANTPQTATKFESVDFAQKDNGVAVNIKADGRINNFESFTIKRKNKLPARIVFDLFNIAAPFENKEQAVSADTELVSRVRYNSYSNKVRIVLDTKDEYLKIYSAVPVSDGLLINVGPIELASAKKAQPDTKAQPLIYAEKNKVTTPQPISASDTSKVKPVTEHVKSAWVNKIDFSSEESGKSTLLIGTTRPVEYKIKKISDRLLHLELNNTNISASRKRTHITTRFNSAVDRILPVQKPAMKNRSIIAIELRESVPYVVEQTDNILKVNFDASSVPPKPEKEADLPEWKEVLSKAPVDGAEIETGGPVSKQSAESKTPPIEPSQKYSGEKIALDFFDTDIKNVFRILREVSGKNFAIDKSVSGKVTLSLEKPVPWDQVLDLVLKMNQLGMVYEGDIIRIAPLEAIKKEEELKQAKFLAEQKSKEQQKSLEELLVEYIPINYSNAKTDILPHLDKIKTKDRGNISVDDRTNLIIITDVAEVIKKAKEIVKRLDRVTPQVIIEARIVEANTNFSREIGTTWGSGVGVQPTSLLPTQIGPNATAIDNRVGAGPQRNYNSLGGTYGINLAMNFPTTSNAASIGFNFVKIAGTPLLLNAKLQAMESQGDGKIVSAPKIVTLDNKEATIKQGLRYPYNKLDTSGNTTTVFEDVDLELKVKPHVTPDNRISMVIKIKKRDLGNIIGGQQSFTTKEAETELLINDGDTVVIGGIIKSTKSSGGSGVPGLSKLPILGWLFKADSDTDNKEELLIFITPRIVQLEQRS
jgi:type IV pilus assembly protein PilQ